MPRRKEVEILYRDASLFAVDKPAGILSVPGRDPGENSILKYLTERGESVIPVHRLDRDTSGVLLFAREPQAHQILSAQFRLRQVTKIYLAIVAGNPLKEEFVIDLALEVDRNNLSRPSKSGKPSKTIFRVVEAFTGFSLIQAIPLTGRQHQVRVHLATARYALAVDPDYGSAVPLRIADIKRSKVISGETSGILMGRTPLHASSLEFRHPTDESIVRIEAPLPKDMRATLNQLRKWR